LLNHPTLTEGELLHKVSIGDPIALEELFRTYFPVLCKFAEKFLPDSALAKDIVQETFIKFWKSERSFESLMSLKGFLFVSTRNGCHNLNRSRGRQEKKHLAATAGDPAEMDTVLAEIVHAESIALIYQVVRSIPPGMQDIFYLSYEAGMTVKEISRHLNVNVNAVKKQKHKVLVLLRSKFGHNREPFLGLLILLLR
jgi:RNA polymerase sigma-70 factor (ECF subfamily)